MKVKVISNSGLTGVCKACEISRGTPFSEELFKRILKSGHLSILEHATITFQIKGISRAASHQFVRKRIASYTQESQRHREIEGITYPDVFDSDKNVKDRVKYEIEHNKLFMDYLKELGFKKEDIRYFSYQASTTSIDVTYNLHSFWNFLDFRFCSRAQEEIRHLARIMFVQASNVFPEIMRYWWPRCVRKFGRYCPEPCTKFTAGTKSDDKTVMKEFSKLREGLFD